MDFIRKKISGNKKRHTECGFDLDLSYITPRVIAMAIPGEGLSKLYRNNIDQVKEFLDNKHKNKYLIINLSGDKYDYELFDDKVLEYDWIDHQAPTIHTLFLICKKMFDYLCADPSYIVVVNCKAGKGRTGTIICCFMLFCGLFDNVRYAMEYYSLKRFKTGKGVTQPSQKRYIYFFNEVLSRKIYYPSRVVLEGIYAKNLPKLNEKNNLRPFFELCLKNNNIVSFTNKKNYGEQTKVFSSQTQEILINEDDFHKIITGDFTISIFNNQRMSDKLIGRLAYNTAFMSNNCKLIEFPIDQIDPDSLVKNDKYSRLFSIIVSISINIYIYSLSIVVVVTLKMRIM